LDIQGGDVEIDRRILEDIKDPLMHLIRNGIGHGIEAPEGRKRNGKPPWGTITIAISQVGSNRAEIVVSDDGSGIDLRKVADTAMTRGLIPEGGDHSLSDQEAISIIFRSGFSTSSVVSNVSGRGLGLAIVRDKVEKLGGRVSLETKPQQGTSFHMVLPVTLATFRGILVRASDQLFVIPTANVERVTRVKKGEHNTVGNKETIEFDGRSVSLLRLNDVLMLPVPDKKADDSDHVHVLVLRVADQQIAFTVDAILEEQEVLVRGLGKQLSRVRNVAGATILGSGKLVPILNVQDLIKSAVKGALATFEPVAASDDGNGRAKSILVAEDSITSRMLLKNILESAGYEVKTAVDGAAAWSALKTEDFDLLVSDVQMPRMTGFELTLKIREDEKLAKLPVVLVTALGSREDRERGIESGANAYIVKSSFDRSDLLETLGRLI
jgi:two-component system chemotaxis sensor kinase CheA